MNTAISKLKILGITALYILLGLVDYNYFTGAIWPGSGFALAVVLLGGWRYLWSIFLGSIVVALILFNAPLKQSILLTVGITTAHLLEAFLGVWLINRKQKFMLQSLNDYLQLIVLGGAVACFIGANISVFSLFLVNFVQPVKYFETALRWWMGDTLGVILVAPLILAWKTTLRLDSRQNWLETVLFIGGTFIVGQIVFLGWFNEFLGIAPKSFVLFLPITLIAIRLGKRAVTFALNMIAIQALAGAHLKVGCFANEIINANFNLQHYWLYIVTLSVVGMALTMYVNEIRQLVEQERCSRIEQSQFMTMLAHELKTPLAVIRMALGSKVISPDVLFHANRAVLDINNVVERCLQLEKLSDYEIKIQLNECSIIDILNDLCYKSNVPERFIINFDISPIIKTDEQLLNTVLSNLIDNALKYSPPKSTISIHVEIEKNGVLITIQNLTSVAGYPDPEKVFQKYYRHKAAHHKTGSGLGLYLVKTITNFLGGDVFYHHNHTSVTFKLWLPL